MIPHGSDVPCEVCAEAPAELVDSEHGPICSTCHENLADVDDALGRIAFTIVPQPTTNPHSHE